MMKFILFIVAAASSTAHASKLECNQMAPVAGQFSALISVQLTGEINGNTITDAKVVADEEDPYDKDSLISKPGTLTAIAPLKKGGRYAKLNRFDLGNLKNQKDEFFAPADECDINLYLPKNADSLSSFSAPASTHCDQGGGFNIYDCTTTK